MPAAMNSVEWNVVTEQLPHWKFGQWDWSSYNKMKIKCYEKPELTQSLCNMYFTGEELDDLLVTFEGSGRDVIELSLNWIYKHEARTKGWVPEIYHELTSNYYFSFTELIHR